VAIRKVHWPRMVAEKHIHFVSVIEQGCQMFYELTFRKEIFLFIHKLALKFEVIVFSRLEESLAKAIVIIFDPTGSLVAHVLGCEHLTNSKADSNKYKDLRLLANGRNLEDIIILDHDCRFIVQ